MKYLKKEQGVVNLKLLKIYHLIQEIIKHKFRQISHGKSKL